MKALPRLTEAPVPRLVSWFAPWRWTKWKQWVAVGVLLTPLGYVASLGPALSLTDFGVLNSRHVAVAYWPLLHLRYHLPRNQRNLFSQYFDTWGGSASRDVLRIHTTSERERQTRQLTQQL